MRGRFTGVANVVKFNWPTFVTFTAIAVVGIALGNRWSVLVGIASAVGVAVALLATHWVYDRSELYHFEWLKTYAPAPRRILRVHTGLDECGEDLARLFPEAEHCVCDIYDPRYAREPSIARARKEGQGLSATANHLPVEDAWSDLTIGFLALHEVRDLAMREKLFAELRRSVRDGGQVIIVEHLRNLANALVYGPGAWHFLPRSAWTKVADAGFTLKSERAITPFVRVFAFEAA